MTTAPNNAWFLSVGSAICKNPDMGLNREWLVTNGLGGYASGSLPGATTRSYHSLLTAAVRPPVERVVTVTKIDEEITLPDSSVLPLGVNEYEDGVIHPRGYQYFTAFSLEGDIPCFTYQLAEDLFLEKRIWMEYGQNTTYVQYTLHGSILQDQLDTPLTLTLSPFCLYRDHHTTTQGSPSWHFLVDTYGNACSVRAYDTALPYRLVMGPGAAFTPSGLWYWHVLHRRDKERGLPAVEDVYQIGLFRLSLTPGRRATLVISAESTLASELGTSHHEDFVLQSMRLHQQRIQHLLSIADRSTTRLIQDDPVYARLVVAADQFIVARPQTSQPSQTAQTPSNQEVTRAPGQSRVTSLRGKKALRLSPDSKTIIAGYPWFTDWGRDSMIALPGLLLYTGRYSEARGLLKAFAAYTHNGLIPNRFLDSDAAPEYNTADATLWMFRALNIYTRTTNDWSLLKELFPTLSAIIQWHLRGTDYGIGVDPQDGLLRAGVPGLQLTWMDAKIGDWIVTPRHGKPVEINALWYCALACMENWACRLSVDALQYGQLRSQVRENFAARFWYEKGGYLYDVVDVDGVSGQNDAALRPNQLFAASLSHKLLSEAQTRSMFQKVTDHLLTPMGLRTLSPSDPAYHKHFNGPQVERDSAYHEGAAWPWLIGPYIDIHLRLFNDKAALLPLLQPLIKHLWYACVGTISELAEPESPFTPVGCFAQAWSVSELLRAWLVAAD